MKSTLNKLLSVLITLVILAGLLPTSIFATVTTYDVWLGNVRVTSENASDIFGDGTASYTAGTNTLSLNGYEGTTYYYEGMVKVGIFSMDRLNISLTGTNSISNATDGIKTTEDLTISGPGTLNMISDNDPYGSAIYTVGSALEINGGATITVNSYAYGLNSDAGAQISGANTDVTVTSTYQGSNDEVNVLGGTLVLKGEECASNAAVTAGDGMEITASENIDGTGAVTYNNSDLYSYKYIKVKPTSSTPTFIDEYPYGTDMSTTSVTLNVDYEGTAYIWQTAAAADGEYADIDTAASRTYSFPPTAGNWYRCVIDNTYITQPIQLIQSTSSNFAKYETNQWYVTNGNVAYSVYSNKSFDIVGKYGEKYINTSYNKHWNMTGNEQSSPDTISYSTITTAVDYIKVLFDKDSLQKATVSAKMSSGFHSLAIGTDTELNNEDYCPLTATFEANGTLNQVQMVEATEPGSASFVIKPVSPAASHYWLGYYNYREYFSYNTQTGSQFTNNSLGYVTSVTGLDTGMTISWTNLADGEVVSFEFSVGTVEDTGATVTHTHVWSTELASDSTAHWHECEAADCDITENSAKDGYEEHFAPTDDNNCTTPVECADCHYIFTAANADHTYTYTASENTITETCSNTGCTVHTATATIVADTAPIIYDGTEKEATVEYSDNWQGGELGIVYDDNIDAGTATATITKDSASAYVTYNIEKAVITVTPDSGKHKVYGEADGAEPSSQLTYTYSGAAAGETPAFSSEYLARESGEDAGEYLITSGGISLNDNPSGSFDEANYTLEFSATPVYFTITKAVPVITTIPAATQILNGSRLENSVLSGGIASVDGTFAWETPTDTMTATSSKKVIFTPTDSTNYTSAECYVTVTVYNRSTGGIAVSSYTVKFDADNESAVKSVRVTKNSKVAEPTEPTKDGFIFDGWYTDKALTDKYDFESKVTRSFNLYAKWIETEKEPDDNTGAKKWNPFIDVTENDWFYDIVKEAYLGDLVNGTTSNTFSPNGDITRGMFITILFRAEGEPEEGEKATFLDIENGAYYENAVNWGAKYGIILGFSDTEYAPDKEITREQMAAILYRYANYKGCDTSVGESTDLSAYADEAYISGYAIPAMKWACGDGVISGKHNGILDPLGNATRAEATAMLVRLLDIIK